MSKPECASTLPAPPLAGQLPNPTPQMLEGDPVFEAIWQVIKKWDINVPEYYHGYCSGNGSHVALIYNAIMSALSLRNET